nr:myosin-11-like isoform X1 [Ciona intestinalis]|eukprot:XP_026690581.1 myosin-11-like isoform X1 [Ciona intestinalis]
MLARDVIKENKDTKEKREAMKKMKELRNALGVSDSYEESFQRHLAEELNVPREVVGKMLEMEEFKALRKRAEILNQLEDCKTRIVNALEMADVSADDIPWGKNDDMPLPPDGGAPVVFVDPTEDKDQAKLIRQAEQSVILCAINQYIAGCNSQAEDMNELIEWMSNFVFEISWDDIGMQPLEDRESDEADSYRGVVLALQRAWKCVRKLEQFIHLMVSDDKFDVLSGKFPPHVVASRQKRNLPTKKLWSSHKLRIKLEQYQNLRTKLSETKKSQNNEKENFNRSVTVLLPGDEPTKDPYKESEAAILNEVAFSWKEATADVMYYIKEASIHRFTKPSCRKRLERAMVMMEFLQAATESKLIVAANTKTQLKETQYTVTRLQDEAAQMQKEMAESQKIIQAARRKITRLKRQLEAVNKENEKLHKKIANFHDQVAALEKRIEELQELPNQSEFDECKERLEELEEEFAELEEETEQLKTDLDSRNIECESFRKKLSEEKEISSNLAEEVQAMEDENDKANTRIKELEEKLSSQESNIMSLRLMVYYKDEVIRRLKQAAIELKSSERRTPKRPPPSPEEGAKRTPEPRREESKTVSNKELSETKKEKPPEREAKSEPKLGETKSETVVIQVTTDKPQEGGEDVKKEPSVTEEPVPKMETFHPASRLYQGKKSPPPKPETKVFLKPDERMEFMEERMRTQQEIAEAHDKLEKMRKEFQTKLKTAVDQEKHKSVLDKMKNEEELQNLCFSVRDETMKVQKEMKNFNDNISKQLEMMIGFKGKLFDESPNPNSMKRRRTTGGLLSVQNTDTLGGVGVKHQTSATGGGCFNQGFMDPGMGGMMGMMGGGMEGGMGGGMMGFEGDMMGMMNPNMMGSNMMDPNSMENSEDQEEEEIGKGNVNYWNNLKSALGVKAPKKEEEEPPVPKRNPLVARVLAEKQRRLSIATNPRSTPDASTGIRGDYSSSSSSTDESEGFRDYLEMVDPELAEIMRAMRPSAGKNSNKEVKKEDDVIKQSGSDGVIISLNVPEIGVGKTSSSEEKSEVQVIESVAVEGKDKIDQRSIQEKFVEPKAEILQKVLIVTNDDGEDEDKKMENQSPVPNLLTVVDRRMARLRDRRRSSVVPFRDVMQIARRQSIRPPPPPKAVKFKGFYSEFGGPFKSKTELEKRRDAISREAAVRRRKEQLEEQEEERRRARRKAIAATTGIDDDPVKQAEVFVRNISLKVNSFFAGMNENLVEAIEKEKSRMNMKVKNAENELSKVRMNAQAQIAKAKEERDKKSSELIKTKKILMNILGGNAITPSTTESSSTMITPYQIISRLKQAEKDLDTAQDKLNKAAKKHENSAEEYRQKSYILDNQIKKSESAKVRAEQKMRQQKAEADFLKVQLHELKVGETQKLLLSLKDHKLNIDAIRNCMDLEENVKNTVVGLLHRSMLFPGVRLHQLVHRYRQHAQMQACMERVKVQLEQRFEARKRRQGKVWNKEKQREYKMLKQLLSRLEARQSHLRQSWIKKRKESRGSRQKILMMITLLFHKIKNEKKDINLIQPIIFKVCGKERQHNNSPVAGFTQPCKDMRLVFPYSSYEGSARAAPNTPVSMTTEGPQPQMEQPENREDFDIIGGKVPEDKSREKKNEPQWFPDSSIFCPFSNRSGTIVPVNSHMDIKQAAQSRYSNGVTLPRLTPATRASIRRNKRPTSPLEMPRIVELEVQGGLRRAKSTIVEKLMTQPQRQFDITQSYTSQIQLREFDTENSDHCLPPIAPDITRPSSIPSPQRRTSRSGTKQAPRKKTPPDQEASVLAKKKSKRFDTKPTSRESDNSMSPSSDRSSSGRSTVLPPI